MNSKNKPTSIWLTVILVIGLVFLVSVGSPMLYGQVTSLENFRRLVIMEHGRKKPLDTYAQNVLKG